MTLSLGFEIGVLYNRYNLHRTQPVQVLVQYVAEVQVAATQRGSQQKQQDFLVKEQGRSRPQPQVAAKVAEIEPSYDQPEYGMEETDGSWSQGPTESDQAWWNSSMEQDGTYQSTWESEDWFAAEPVAQFVKKGKPKGKGKGGASGSSGGNPPSAVSKGKGKKPSSSSVGNCRAYMTDEGCPKGNTCWYGHPPLDYKCLRCGSTKHSVSECPRPKSANPSAGGNPPSVKKSSTTKGATKGSSASVGDTAKPKAGKGGVKGKSSSGGGKAMFVIHEGEEGEQPQDEMATGYDADWSYPEGTEPATQCEASEEAVTGQRDANQAQVVQCGLRP